MAAGNENTGTDKPVKPAMKIVVAICFMAYPPTNDYEK
jgi:hypothetical protein